MKPPLILLINFTHNDYAGDINRCVGYFGIPICRRIYFIHPIDFLEVYIYNGTIWNTSFYACHRYGAIIMNLFILDKDPVIAAEQQCNKHVVKMALESGQMLSTAHRMLDGSLIRRPSKSGRTQVKYYVHPNPLLESILYKAVHFNHPCTVWTRESSANYEWHYQHFIALCDEYTYRYERVHRTDAILRNTLKYPPRKIPHGSMTPFKLAMKSNPECMFEDNPVQSYRMFYQTKQARFSMNWSKREIPEWFEYK